MKYHAALVFFLSLLRQSMHKHKVRFLQNFSLKYQIELLPVSRTPS